MNTICLADQVKKQHMFINLIAKDIIQIGS